MKSLASLALILTTAAFAQEPPAGDGPRGSSVREAGDARYDEVGYADVAARDGLTANVRGLGAKDYVEVTSLDSGRTIMLAVAGGTPDGTALATLSAKAAQAIILPAGGGVRVRRVTALPQDVAQIGQGLVPPARLDAPEGLLIALRKRLPPRPAAVAAVVPPAAARPVLPTPRRAPTPVAAAKVQDGGYWVQVATLSNAANAATLATKVGGVVVPAGTLRRVRIGPLPDRAAAERARARAVSIGYRDATITRN